MTDHQPLSEVFGYPVDNMSAEANRCRTLKLCPFSNKVPNCTKDKVENPLGVCSIFDKNRTAIICPIRFRQDWLIIEDAANLFFPKPTLWTTFTDIKLLDVNGKSVGIIDFILVSYDHKGHVKDFGILETQASYVTQNLRRPFDQFMDDPERYKMTDYKGRLPYADYTASIQRRLSPRLIFKGGIFHIWQKKMAFAIVNYFNIYLSWSPSAKAYLKSHGLFMIWFSITKTKSIILKKPKLSIHFLNRRCFKYQKLM